MDNELQDLFKDTGSEAPSEPLIVTFSTDKDKDDKYDQKEGSERTVSGGPKKRGRPPAKNKSPYEKKPKKERKKKSLQPSLDSNYSVLDSYSHILNNNDPLSNFIVPDSVPNPTSSSSMIPTLNEGPSMEEKEKEKKLAAKRSTLKQFTFGEMKRANKPDQEIKSACQRVDSMKESDIDFELQKITFTQNEHFTDTVADMIKNTTGWVSDKMLNAEGEVAKQFEKDVALKDLIRKNIMGRLNLFGPSAQMVVLAGGDVYQGMTKKWQKKLNGFPQNSNLKEENSNKP